ncbi:MAG: acyltransferase [Rhodocyclales bacterium]|jgi:nitrilase|nr:carbon-nitrogen hydrolase family protein [Rhodocyclaceae bacterium]PWB39353.1 MAG: acyltransferase [Rhodocyclales bacterium]
MTPTRIAAVQMVSGPDIAQNLRVADALVAEAAAGGARLVALPEYFPLISGNETDKVRAREKDGAGPLQDFLRETAQRHQVWLVGGSIPLEASIPEKVRNSCLVYDDAGRRVARYDKIHLFGFTRGTERYNESQTIEAGGEVVVFDSPVGRVGLSICYDLRFPELYRAMGAVDLLVVPAAFTHTTGQAHWELLLRARAVENLCYVLASAQGGTHPSGRRTWGDSMVVDPWGEVLGRLAEGPGVVTAEMDAARIAELRASLPALQHRVL